MKADNEFKLTVESKSVNENFARVAVSAFVSQLDPTVEELGDITMAVSEAVTNCIVHAYREKPGKIYISAGLYGNIIKLKIRDKGCGISDIKKAMEPLYSTAGDERAGLGFAVMESFTDKIKVTSTLNKGTTVYMEKHIAERIDVNG